MHKQLHTQVTVTNQWIIIINSTDMYDSTATNHCIRKTFMQTGSKPHPPIIAFNPFTDNNYFIIISISQAVVSMKIDPFPHSSQPSSHPRSVLFCQTSSFASPCLLNLLKVCWIHICMYLYNSQFNKCFRPAVLIELSHSVFWFKLQKSKWRLSMQNKWRCHVAPRWRTLRETRFVNFARKQPVSTYSNIHLSSWTISSKTSYMDIKKGTLLSRLSLLLNLYKHMNYYTY